MMRDENVEIVRRGTEAFNARDWETWRSVMHPDFRFVDHQPAPDASGEAVGIDAVERVVRKWTSELDDFRCEVHELIPSGDRVISVVTWRGTGRGSAAPVEWQGADVCTLRDGLIVLAESGSRNREEALNAAPAAVPEKQA
jgi:ketosteroid isomerase-like protein